MNTGSRKEQQVHTPAPTPSRAIKGLVLYLGCRGAFLFYLIWVLVPDPWLKQAGIDFLPHKYWAVALPVLACVILAFTAFLIYPALGLILTPTVKEQESFVDEHSFQHLCDDSRRTFPSQKFIPTSQVSRVLFSKVNIK